MVSLWQIFTVFFKIGAFTIGGGYMMVPAIEAQMRKLGWISEDELPDIVALSQSAPGLLTVNMAIFAGNKLRGIKGSIAATFGVILAPFLTILAIAIFFAGFKDSPVIEAIFKGVRPVAIAIIAAYATDQFRRNSKWWQLAISFATIAAIALLKISAVYILLIVIIIALGISLIKK